MAMERADLQHLAIVSGCLRRVFTFRGGSGLIQSVTTPPTRPTPPSTPKPGEIRRNQPTGAPPRLVLITGYEHRPGAIDVARALLLTNEIEYANGDETFIPADHTPDATGRPVRPYHLLAHEFPLYLNPTHLSAALHREVATLLLDHPKVPLVCRSPLSPQPGSEPWEWKIAELHASYAHNMPLCCLLEECDATHHPSGT